MGTKPFFELFSLHDCPQCAIRTIKAQATTYGEYYWYCQNCKKELSEMRTTNVLVEAAKFQLDQGFRKMAEHLEKDIETEKAKAEKSKKVVTDLPE